MSENLNELITRDRESINKNRKKLTNLTDDIELCPHSSATSEYIGEGDTENTCNTCGYNWITSNPSFHE